MIPNWFLYLIAALVTLALGVLAGLGVVLISIVRAWWKWKGPAR